MGPRLVQGGPARLPQRECRAPLIPPPVPTRPAPQFKPDIEYWLHASNTYRVIFIQDQASWFVVTGHDFVLDGHGAGGLNGNGQAWWSYFANRTRADGDGRPVSLTLSNVSRATVRDFRIEAQPFWCNAVANSQDITYDGMKCNATNTNPEFFGQKCVPLYSLYM